MPLASGRAKKILATRKVDTRVIGPVTRHLLGLDLTAGRQQDCIHPSEAARTDWCPRRDFYRISVAKGLLDIPAKPQVGSSLWMEKIYDDGHESGRKWQNWVRQMGRLRGEWKCLHCKHTWMDTSPVACPECGADDWDQIAYLEVPCGNEKYLLFGRADGDVDDPDLPIEEQVLFENKYLGTGTLRIEVPKRVAEFTFEVEGRKYVDWEDLWFKLRRPFPSHFRQLLLYMFCLERKAGVVIYEPKFMSGQPREFPIRLNLDYIEDILDACLDVKYAVDNGRAPSRPEWAERDKGVCKLCPFSEGCWSKQRNSVNGSAPSAKAAVQSRKRATNGRDTAAKANIQPSSGSSASRRSRRSQPDGTIRQARSVSGLSLGSTRQSRNRGSGLAARPGGR